MVIKTQGDARTALLQLSDDLNATALQVSDAGQNEVNQNYAYGALGTALNYNTDSVLSSSAQLLLTAEATVTDFMSTLIAPDSTPLTTQELATMGEIRSDVISDRLTVGSSISSVDWTLGGIFDDTVSSIENVGTSAIASVEGAVKSAVTPSWSTYVWGAVVIFGLFFIWREVG